MNLFFFVIVYSLGLAVIARHFFTGRPLKCQGWLLAALAGVLLAFLLTQDMTDFLSAVLMLGAMPLVLALPLQAAKPPYNWLRWSIILYVLILYFAGDFGRFSLATLEQMNPQQIPFEVRLNTEKAVIALILAAGISRYHRSVLTTGKFCFIGLGFVSLILLSLIAGLSWYPKWDNGIALLIAVNLFVTVVSEEIYFRVYLQEAINGLIKNEPLLLAVMAVLFSALHFAWVGGWQGFLLVAVAGYLYAWTYRHVSLFGAILTHAAVNTLHMIFFAYPMMV